MKLFHLSFLLLGLSCTAYGQTYFDEHYLTETGYDFNGLDKIMQADIFTTYKSQFGLLDNDAMVKSLEEIGTDGKFSAKYVQYHDGYPVEGSMMMISGDKSVVQYAHGFILKGLDVNTSGIISMDEALNTALEYVNAEAYSWNEVYYDPETGAAITQSPPQGELIIAKKRGEKYEAINENFTLCWKFNVTSVLPAGNRNIYVDAINNEIFTEDGSMAGTYEVDGHLWTWYNGEHWNIRTATCTACTNYRLDNYNQNLYLRNFGYPNNAVKDGNNNWVESSYMTESSAFWAVQRTWNYFRDRHGREGSDYQKRKIVIVTKTPAYKLGNIVNAGYEFGSFNSNVPGPFDNIYMRDNNTAIPMPSGSTAGLGYSVAVLDVLAHEYTHAMIHASSDLGSLGDYDARSLNEAYADIFGMLTERYVYGYPDWAFGEKTGSYQRNFADPHTDWGMATTTGASASKYLEPGYWGDIYANGGVLRKWFHLLSNGGTFNGVTVAPLGVDVTERISNITFNWWLWCNVRYPEAVSQTIAAVKAHWGNCSQEHKQTVYAFRAVGFNPPIPFCFRPEIWGDGVVFEGKIAKFTARLNDIDDKDGRFEWIVPDGWDVTISRDVLTLNATTNTSSTILGLKYITTSGEVLTAEKAVHFSSESWTPTLPMETIEKEISLEQSDLQQTIVYPNPARDYVNILLPYDISTAKAEIYDLNGRKLLSTDITHEAGQISIQTFPAGIYVVHIIQAGEKVFKKLSIVK